MNSNSPLVCVCIPVYNGAKTIGLTISSILAQNYPDFEIIVCDNLSTDSTLMIVEELKKTSKIKISILRNTNTGTAEDNWNFMLSNIKTEAEYLTVYHADDLYLSTILSEEVDFMQQYELMASFTLCRLIDEDGNDITEKNNYNPLLPKQITSPIFRFEELLKYILRFRNFFITPSFMFKREVLTSIHPFFDNPKSKSSSDLDTWLRISKHFKIGILQKTLMNYRISTSQGSFLIKQGRIEPADFFQVVDSHLNELKDHTNYRREIRYYNILKFVDLTICAVNILKSNETKDVENLLKRALKLSNMIIISRIKYIRIFLFAIFMLGLLKLKWYKMNIDIAKRINL